MTDREIEMKLKTAVERSAPDGLSRLLSAVDDGKGDEKMEKTNKKRNRWIGAVAAILAVALIGGAGGFYYSRNMAVATVVSLDVNPSIELRVNASEKVLKCTALNSEATEILASMSGGKDLEGAKLDVAVNAIVGAIVRAGYLDSLNSAILISVDDSNADRGARLQAELVAAVDGVLQTASNGASVMSQYVTGADLSDKAQQNNISTGKAALIEQVLTVNPTLDFSKLAALSVEELRDLIKIGAPSMPIGRDEAANIAEEYAGTSVLDRDVVFDVDPELDDPVPHYEVEIRYDREYDYTIHAFTGEVLSGQAGIVVRTPSTNPTATDTHEPGITADEAFNAAAKFFSEKHPELVGNFLNITTEYDRDDGHYDVEFWCRGYEFDYDVDGKSGDILREETDYRYTPPAPTEPAPTTPAPTEPAATTPQSTDIGADAAKSAALKHAGLSANQVTFIKAQRDYDDGRLVYDVEFYTSDTEYDYEIAAADGAVMKYETEKRPNVTAPTTPQPTDIGADAAKAAALKRAGIADAASVTWMKCQHDWDDGWQKYELEFECGATVYECDVDAASGTVTKFESEPCDNLAHHHNEDHHDEGGHSSGNADIGADAAKNAALSHAGLSSGQVTQLKCERDYDDGRLVYEVEFKSGGYEYDYKIDASTGAVLEHERDRDD